jgi:hypothetical protein
VLLRESGQLLGSHAHVQRAAEDAPAELLERDATPYLRAVATAGVVVTAAGCSPAPAT